MTASTEVRPTSARRRPPERNVLENENFGTRLRHLRYRFSLQQLFAELFEKRWMEPAIPLAILVGVIIFFSIAAPGFATSANLLSSAAELAEISLVCLGMAIVMISGGIDLSVGSMFGLCNIVVLLLITVVGVPVVPAILLTIMAGAVLGSINGSIVAYLKARPFLTTLVTLIIFRGVLNLLDLHYSAQTATVFLMDPVWDWFSTGKVAGIPFSFVTLLVVLVAGHILLSRSRLGWHVTAVGASRRAARHAGIRVERVLLLGYVFSGALCALAGVFYAARLGSASARVGEGMELSVLTAVILGGISLSGGKGTVWRAFIGAATITLLGKGLLLMDVGGEVLQTTLAVVLILAVGIDTKWGKNRGKAIQKTYVNPTLVEYGPPPDVRPGSGTPYEINDRLGDAEEIGLGEVEGPEDVILDDQGRIYCGTRQGWILRFSGEDYRDREVFARIGGHPLGLAFDSAGNLIVCVGGMGLYSVSPDGKHRKLSDETSRTWTRLRDDSRLRLPDDLDITPDGKIYFSEATNRFEMADWVLDGIEGRPNGRLLCYDPATGKTRTVVPDLVFPNGVCCAHDGESVLIAQTWLCRILRYWHSGPKKGRLEVFMDNFPGYVDNINRASGGAYWVAICGMRSPAYDLAMRMPKFRRRMMKRISRDEWLYPSMNHGCVVRVSEQGEVLDTYWDPGGKKHSTITSMREHDGYLYIGGLENNRIGRIKVRDLPEAASGEARETRHASVS
ncbi:ABC transporter permease [Amycolatopsis thermophila]|uniref:Ribose transport system permease protein n=1 Tax=Amycolatopsis thermophila TaxID=206084 RepID=A0ABU0ELY3_9PSEU|nr:SMP-30/gluconolactonase/LRE family protein [Amycolatopsis thermophila]MDQ0376056.1 ribose transport system permease protein [Amycolatopsis thermophila]